MTHMYGSLKTPLSVVNHSPAELVTDNPAYTTVTIDNTPVYTVKSPIGAETDIQNITLEKD